MDERDLSTVRRRGKALVAGAIVITLGVAGSVPAAAATASASVDAPAAASLLDVGDPGRPPLGSRRDAPEPVDPAGGFIYRHGRYTQLDGAPGAPVTGHLGLNNRHQIVGSYPVDGSTLLRGFVRSRTGSYQGFDAALGAPDRFTTPFDVNDRGQIVGTYAVGSAASPESVVFHGFVRSPDGSITTVDVPGASGTAPSGINNRGAVVGSYLDPDGRAHGFLMERGAVTPIDPPGAANVYPGGANIQAFDINDRGQIVDFYPDARGTFHGFLYHRGGFTALDPPQAAGNRNGFGATAAFGVNNRG